MTKNSVKAKAFAKLNLSLFVTGKTNDNFHDLDMVFCSVDIFDKVVVSKRNDRQVKVCMDKKLQDEKNTATQAAKLFCQTFGTPGVDVKIEKSIPFAGGCGGSSADAAAVLVSMSKLFEVDDWELLLDLGLKIGSDVPYMMTGGFAHAKGRGEKLSFFTAPQLFFVLVTLPCGLSTAKVFDCFDKKVNVSTQCNESLLEQLKKGNLEKAKLFLHNDLQQTACELLPMLKNQLETASQFGSVLMTGSGSCFFVLCESLACSLEVERQLVKLGLNAKATKTTESGICFE